MQNDGDADGSARQESPGSRQHHGKLVSVPGDGSVTAVACDVDNGAEPADIPACRGGPQSAVAREICRGVVRVLAAHGFAAVAELPLPNGRRADVVGLAADGALWIVEIKSCLEDFRSDHKWPEYRAYCDRLLFAVLPQFPAEILPPDVGLIVADRYGGEIQRAAPLIRLPAPVRKAMTLSVARVSAARLSVVLDPALPAAIGRDISDA